ncbi:hypothetical protein [Bermanella sp. R86510]|uniref:hypothetical protein n=1 Tax=unclassified Bermanella TaxID=2627862 RepID=UPI0037CA9911
MSRKKKTRSLKRVTGGIKTGSKERMKLENKQRKAKKKAANPRKVERPRSVYQRFLDENNLVEPQHMAKKPAPVKAEKAKQEDVQVQEQQKTSYNDEAPQNLWDQLERPKQSDTF